jgi:hypothetical protein
MYSLCEMVQLCEKSEETRVYHDLAVPPAPRFKVTVIGRRALGHGFRMFAKIVGKGGKERHYA